MTAPRIAVFVVAVIVTACIGGGTPETPPAATSVASAAVEGIGTLDGCSSRPKTPARLAPQRISLALSEEIDAPLGAVFVEAESGDVTVWVIPEGIREFGVAPSGTYIVYQPRGGGCYRLLRTDDASDRAIEASALPVAYGPGDSGFVATTQSGFVVSQFDARGEQLRDLWLGGVTRLTDVAWAPDGSALAYVIAPGGSATVTLAILPVSGAAPTQRTAVGASHGAPIIEWSEDSERIAVVTPDFVTVVSRNGEVLWEAVGDFACRPRWSADSRALRCRAQAR